MSIINSDLELSTYFDKNEKNYLSLIDSDLSYNSEEFQSKLKELLLNFFRISQYINKNNIISKNEEIEDIKTEDIKFILSPYYTGQVFLKVQNIKKFDREMRVKMIKQGLVSYFYN